MSECSGGAYIRRYASTNQPVSKPSANRAPTLVKNSAPTGSVAAGQLVSIAVTATDPEGKLTNIDLAWNDGSAVAHRTVSGSTATAVFTNTFTTARTINWSSTAYGTAGAASNMVTGSFTVTAPNRAPTLVKNSAPTGSVAAGQPVSIAVTATDPEGKLTNIDLAWNDGSAVAHRTVSGSTATAVFTNTFTTARTINWSSTAYDTAGAASNMVTGSFTVTAPNRAPTLVKNSAPTGSVAAGQPVSIAVTATDPEGKLTNIDLAWNDGSAVVHRTVSGSTATAVFTNTFTTARTINWSSTAYDTAGAASNMLTGSFTVTAPNRAPTLVKNSAPTGSVAAGQTVSIAVTATDPEGKLTNIDLAWNDGSAVVHRTVSGSTATAIFTNTFTTARTINWSSTAYDTAGAASNMVTGSFTVTAPNRAPTLVKSSAPSGTVTAGQTVSITVTATDPEGKLSNIDLAWNDGGGVAHRTVRGSTATATFTKVFTTAQTFNWSSTAYDTTGAASNIITGSFGVR